MFAFFTGRKLLATGISGAALRSEYDSLLVDRHSICLLYSLFECKCCRINGRLTLLGEMVPHSQMRFDTFSNAAFRLWARISAHLVLSALHPPAPHGDDDPAPETYISTPVVSIYSNDHLLMPLSIPLSDLSEQEHDAVLYMI